MNSLIPPVKAAIELVQSCIEGFDPELLMVLGSGMGMLADEIQNPITISYSEIPQFPESTVKGHAGALVFGELMGKKVMAMKGRIHFYEGHPIQTLAFPVRLAHQLGVRKMLVTNAAGGVNPALKAGDLMLMNDHLNFTLNNPLIGPNDSKLGPRFPNNATTYSPELQELARKAAQNVGIELKEGVYMFFTGPSYETPAEVRMSGILGADAVGMSTFPEALTANHLGIEVLGISFIANMAAGIQETELSHAEVIEAAEQVKPVFRALIMEIVSQI